MEDEQALSEAKAKILIVDDESTDRELTARALSQAGEDYEILTAADASAAKTMLSRERVDVVISDVKMPGVSGIELMQWAQDNHPGATWILLTGRGEFDDAVRAVSLGAFEFLVKQMGDADSIRIAVRNAVRQRRLEAEQRRLSEKLSEQNERLRMNVSQLNDACELLCAQADTIDEDLRRAEMIQRALLPRNAPRLSGLTVDTLYRPSRIVGGDLYDVARVNDRYLIAYVADAAGHGVSAAMLAVIFKHRLEVVDERTGHPARPAEVLAAVNQCLIGEGIAPGLFVTAAYCLLDTETCDLVVSSAGHPPQVIRHASGQVEWIYHTGPAMGISSSARFAEYKTRLGRGDRMLLFTDGLYDGDLERSILIEELIVAALKNDKSDGYSLLMKLLTASAEQRGEAPQDDDITMLLLTGAESTSRLDNGIPTSQSTLRAFPIARRAQLLFGMFRRQSFISIKGSGKWDYSSAFHEACVTELEAGRPLVLDMSLCEYLDSTFLGTVQEIVHVAREKNVGVRIQGVLPAVRRLFEELGMDAVLRCFSGDIEPLPTEMHLLSSSTLADPQSRLRILQAHETIARLNERNRRKFVRVIEALRSECPEQAGEEESSKTER